MPLTEEQTDEVREIVRQEIASLAGLALRRTTGQAVLTESRAQPGDGRDQ